MTTNTDKLSKILTDRTYVLIQSFLDSTSALNMAIAGKNLISVSSMNVYVPKNNLFIFPGQLTLDLSYINIIDSFHKKCMSQVKILKIVQKYKNMYKPRRLKIFIYYWNWLLKYLDTLNIRCIISGDIQPEFIIPCAEIFHYPIIRDPVLRNPERVRVLKISASNKFTIPHLSCFKNLTTVDEDEDIINLSPDNYPQYVTTAILRNYSLRWLFQIKNISKLKYVNHLILYMKKDDVFHLDLRDEILFGSTIKQSSYRLPDLADLQCVKRVTIYMNPNIIRYTDMNGIVYHAYDNNLKILKSWKKYDSDTCIWLPIKVTDGVEILYGKNEL
jgi:hypothetical protein